MYVFEDDKWVVYLRVWYDIFFHTYILSYTGDVYRTADITKCMVSLCRLESLQVVASTFPNLTFLTASFNKLTGMIFLSHFVIRNPLFLFLPTYLCLRATFLTQMYLRSPIWQVLLTWIYPTIELIHLLLYLVWGRLRLSDVTIII